MSDSKYLDILYRAGLFARYYGPGYFSWHAVQDYI